MYIFLDESGQFQKSSDGNYFIIGSFATNDQRRIERQFRSWQRRKFPRKMRTQSEIKWSDMSIDDRLRCRTLEHISKLDVRVHFTYLQRGHIPERFIQKGKINKGLLYTQVVSETLGLYLPSTDSEFRIFCDNRHLKGMKRTEFKQMIITRVLPDLPNKAKVQVEMLDSTTNACIQVADWITGALAWYLEDKGEGEKYKSILKNNLLGSGKELFTDYWHDEN